MEHRIQALNVEIGKFKEFMEKFHALFAQENFNYNILESQFEQLRIRNQQLAQENVQAEAKIRDSLNAADKIMEDAREHERQIKSSVMVLFHKAQARFQEIEDKCAASEKRQIEKHLKEMETAVA